MSNMRVAPTATAVPEGGVSVGSVRVLHASDVSEHPCNTFAALDVAAGVFPTVYIS
jgi:hypothetical protein